jgi:hypothetical protein
MPINESLLEIREYTGDGYKPVVDYGAWRVAILRWKDDMLPQNINAFQRHLETDEVFVLLAGKCILFIGDGDEQITGIYGEDMVPLKMYNVKRRAWHFHTVSEDAVVLIVENRDTTSANSSDIALNPAQKALLAELTDSLWSTDKSHSIEGKA